MRDISRRTKKYRSYLGTNLLALLAWLVVCPLVVSLTFYLIRETFGFRFNDDAMFFQTPFFISIPLVGVASGFIVLFVRKTSTLETFYASLCARVVARWSFLFLAGIVATIFFQNFFSTSFLFNEKTFRPFVEATIAFALLFELISRLTTMFRRNSLQQVLLRRTSTRIAVVLLGCLIADIVMRTKGYDFWRVLAAWGAAPLAFMLLCISEAIRARLRKGTPSAILHSGASRVYFCCCDAAVLSLLLGVAFPFALLILAFAADGL